MKNKGIILCILVCVLASLCYGIGERLWLRTMYPSSNYGITYNPTNNRVYYTKFYQRYIYIVSADSFCTSYGTIPTPNNESACVDIKYCSYDNTFWVLSNLTKRVYKISPTGTVLRWFNSPANDYPSGLAWDAQNRQLYIADRRTAGGAQAYIYCCDTMGNVIRQMNHPINAWYGPRGLVYVPPDAGHPAYLLNVYTFFNSSSLLDSAGVFALNPQNCQVMGFFRYNHPTNDSSNIRGIEYDPRDRTYWVSLFLYGT